MPQKKIPMESATVAQLKDFAETMLGIKVPGNIGKMTLISKIRPAWKDPDIVVDEDDNRHLENAAAAAVGAAGDAARIVDDVELIAATERTGSNKIKVFGSKIDPRILLRINPNDSPGGDRPVFVSVNNVGILLPRDETIEIAYRYFEVLKNAVKTVAEENRDGEDLNFRAVRSYPYEVLRWPDPAEVNDWMRKTSSASIELRAAA